MIQLLIAATISFAFTIFVTPIAIRVFRARSIGQFIQEDVHGHLHKRGTPTMGGVVIIFGAMLGYAGAHFRIFTLGEGIDLRMYPFTPEGMLAVLAFVGAEKVEAIFQAKQKPVELTPQSRPRLKLAMGGSLAVLAIAAEALSTGATAPSVCGKER